MIDRIFAARRTHFRWRICPATGTGWMLGIFLVAIGGCGPASAPPVAPVKISTPMSAVPPHEVGEQAATSAAVVEPEMPIESESPDEPEKPVEPAPASEVPADLPPESAPPAEAAELESAVDSEELANVSDSKNRYKTRENHDPDGIGKFYLGREIAHVMGYQAADWLERPRREEEEKLSKLVEALKLKPGMTVADIGAGSGVITLMLAHEVLPDGKAIAVDVQQEMLDLLNAKLKLHDIKNVELLLGTSKSPRLEPASVDLALMVDVYHEFEFPYEMMLNISRSMKPGGRVVLVEYRKGDPRVQIKLVHKMTVKQARREMAVPEFRLKWKETIETLPQQHIIIFEKQAEGA